MQFWALVKTGLREALDRRIFWIVLGIILLAGLAMACIGIEGNRVTVLFGLWQLETPHYNPAGASGRSALLSGAIHLIMVTVLGRIGMVLILIATAGFFPAMMEAGAVDVLLAKPISRARLFLYKYAASLVFVLIEATVFIVLTFLVMGLRWNLWAPGYLLGIPLIVLLFSYVYCISVLVAVKTRSTVAAILLSLTAWVLYAAPREALNTFEAFPELKEHRRVYDAVRVLAWVPPKSGDIPYLASRWAGGGSAMDVFPEAMMNAETSRDRRQRARAREVEATQLAVGPVASIGSSLLFEAVVLAWAMASFTRRDF